MENAILQGILAAGILVTLCMTVFYSYKSRRSGDAKLRGLFAARMNICMGVMLLLISFIQMFLFPGSTVRVIVGAVFMLLGLFNLFAGIRNHGYYRSLSERQ